MNSPSDAHRNHVVVIGAGHGGAAVVACLRQYGYDGDITLIGAESLAPYQRPPLSKAWLNGQLDQDALLLRPESFYATQNIRLCLATVVEKVDAGRRCVVLANGEEIHYDQLILATGANPRVLAIPGAKASNVLTLRTLADAERIRACLAPGKKLVLIGGGYIGLECAATARKMGMDVVVLERAARLLERIASAPVSAFLQQFHQNQGVSIELNAGVEAILTQAGTNVATAVQLTDGRALECDVVLVGVGASPAVELAQSAGLTCNDGILVDRDCRSSDPAIFAMGDAAKRPHSLYQRELRLESVPSAQEQARHIAAVLTGRVPADARYWES